MSSNTKRLVKKVGSQNLTPELKEKLKACVPDSKVVMGRAKRGLYAGRHIQYGNQISEDGGNKLLAVPETLSEIEAQENTMSSLWRSTRKHYETTMIDFSSFGFVAACGVCHSDLHVMKGEIPDIVSVMEQKGLVSRLYEQLSCDRSSS